MIYFIAFIIVYSLHVLLKLNLYMAILLGIFACIMVPRHKKRYEVFQRNKKRFYEVSSYLDTLLYSFVKEEKIVLAISDVSQTLPQGDMKYLVEKAFDYMQMTFDEIAVLQEGLRMIEVEYPCQRLKDVHQFMIHVEHYGGEIEKPVNLLLADKGRWERRITEAIAQRNKQFIDVILSVAAALMICGAIVYLPVMDMDISKEWAVQMFAAIVVILNDFIVYKAQKFLMVDWIQVQLTENEDYYVKKPTKEQFLCCCNEFWWCLNNVAKGLWRREIPYAQDMVNFVVRKQLEKMISWKIGIETDFAVSVGKSSKYMYKWISEKQYEAYLDTYFTGTVVDGWRAVFVMTKLFGAVASEVAGKLEYEYNFDEEKSCMEFLKHVRNMVEDADEF